MIKAILFTDYRRREDLVRSTLAAEEARLNKIAKPLPPGLQNKLNKIAQTLAQPVADPVYTELQKIVGEFMGDPGSHTCGFPVTSLTEAAGGKNLKKLGESEQCLAAIYGLMLLDNHTDTENPKFREAAVNALGEYKSEPKQTLFSAVLNVVLEDGDISRQQSFAEYLSGVKRKHASPGYRDDWWRNWVSAAQILQDTIVSWKRSPQPFYLEISPRNWAATVRSLSQEGISADDSLLPLRVRNAMAKVTGAGEGTPTSTLEICLPDLEEKVEKELQRDNLLAMQALYFSMTLEEMRLFQARDLALEQWQLGMIVTGRSRAGDLFYQMWRKTPERLTELERQSLYSRAFGYAGGDVAQGAPNRQFKTLWIRFLSAVSQYTRQFKMDTLFQARVPLAVHAEQLRQSGRDLAANLTLHGYGVAFFAAKELEQEIRDIIELFSEAEIKAAYAARDMYQVVEQLLMFSGRQVESTVQKRVTARSGGIVIRWLAERIDGLSGRLLSPVLDQDSILQPVYSDNPLESPTDSDLVNAVEQWLSVNGVQDEFIVQNAQAMEPPRMASRPFPMPQVGRELLESVSVQAGGLSYPGSGSNGGRQANASGRR